MGLTGPIATVCPDGHGRVLGALTHAEQPRRRRRIARRCGLKPPRRRRAEVIAAYSPPFVALPLRGDATAMTSHTLDGRYELVERLGSGGAGEVWRAHDHSLKRAVAVKLLARELADDPETTARFRSEATSAAKLSHPHAVTLYDVGRDGRDYLVMELVDGGTLTDLGADGPLPAEVVAAVGWQVARALGAAHSRGLVHRDVTPGNVLLARDGTAKLSDFGIARSMQAAASRLTSPGQVVGTARYLAPEQLRDEAVDARVDVYALGLVLFELATGHAPFGDGSPTEVAMRRLAEPLARPRELRGDVPAALDEALARATAAEPSARYAHGGELAAALEPLADPHAATVIAQRLATEPGESGSQGQPGHTDADADPDEAPTAAADTGGPRARSATAVVAAAESPTAGGDTTALGPAAVDAEADGALPSAGTARPPSWPRLRRWQVVAVAAVLGLAGVTGALLAIDEPAADQNTADEDSQIADNAGGPLDIVGAGDHDPGGSDGREHPEDVAKAFDGDPATVWQTQRYYGDAALGNLKSGVGVWFDVGAAQAVDALEIATTNPGSDLTVYAGQAPPQPNAGPAAWGTHVVDVADADRNVRLDLEQPVSHRVWLLWFTRLPAATGDGYRATVAEVDFRAP
jgi:serine/threonine-protein kinase